MEEVLNSSKEIGLIIRGIGGFYYVLMPDGTELECRARGKFRSMGLSPLVGDHVKVLKAESGYDAIEEILPRKTVLKRPAAANVSRVIIVMAATHPEADLLLCDKLIIEAQSAGIEPVLAVNKCDEAKPSDLEQWKKEYASFPVFFISCHTGQGIEALKEQLKTGISCLAGQSAVGKSTLLNTLIPGTGMETGGLSRKTDRGRHTTRHAELVPFGEGAILDTPGFSLYDTPLLSQEELDHCYPEFGALPESCYFAECSHTKEPNCAVKQAVSDGLIPKSRYERYLLISQDIKKRRQHQYD